MTDEFHEGLRVPDEGLQFAPPMRAYHLTGGLSLLIASNRLAMLMPIAPGMTFFSLLQEASITTLLQKQEGIRNLGLNYFAAAHEMAEPVTQQFAISVRAQNGWCLATAQSTEWSGVGNTLYQSNRGADALVATRIASQVHMCLARFERLSTAYRTVLTQVWTRQTPSPSTFTSDKYAAYLSIEYRAMLNELYALRDAVLVGAYRFRFNRDDPFTMKKLKALVIAETKGAAELISHSMFSDVGDRLIDHMALYRSVAQHCLGATNPIFAGDVYQLRLSTGPFGDLPYIVYPLYDDVEKMRSIERGSSIGILERPPIEEVTRFANLGHYRDGLEFCYDCFVRLLKVSELLRAESGIEPRPITITDNEILELSVTDETGKTRRAKRDPSGRLVEY
jgi:hypothetical protein